jgi:hypothetical protein
VTTALLAFEFLPSVSRLKEQSLLYNYISVDRGRKEAVGGMKRNGVALKLQLYTTIVRPLMGQNIISKYNSISSASSYEELANQPELTKRALTARRRAKDSLIIMKLAKALMAYQAAQKDYRERVNDFAREAALTTAKDSRYAALDKKRSYLLLTRLRCDLLKRSTAYKKPKVIKFAKQVSDFDFSRQSSRYVNHTYIRFLTKRDCKYEKGCPIYY